MIARCRAIFSDANRQGMDSIMSRGDAHRQMRRHTLELILNALAVGPLDKRSIQRQTARSWGAVSEGIAFLEERGVVKSDGLLEEGKLGRRASAYCLDAKRNISLGMALNDSKVFTSAVSLSGELVFKDELECEGHISSSNALSRVHAACRAAMKNAAIDASQVGQLCLALPGAVNSQEGIWVRAPFPSLKGPVDFGREIKLGSKHSIPLNAEHDLSAMAQAIMKRESWSEPNFAFLNFSDGVGMVVSLNGSYFSGVNGYACEIGHIPFASGADARDCRCGKKGCLETLLSCGGIAYAAKRQFGLGDGKSFKTLTRSMGEECRLRLFEELLPQIERACVSVVTLFDPGTIVLGGPALEPWLDLLRERLPEKLSAGNWLNAPVDVRFYKGGDREECAYGSALRAAGLLMSGISAELA